MTMIHLVYDKCPGYSTCKPRQTPSACVACRCSHSKTPVRTLAQWEESFFPKTSVAIVILFWLKWAGYLAVAGLNLLAQLSDRISPYGV